jgi:hypothetical protein
VSKILECVLMVIDWHCATLVRLDESRDSLG